MMATYTTYRRIKSVFMASSNHVERVNFEPAVTLKDITYDDGDIEIDELYPTKDSVLEYDGGIIIQGYGKHSGRTLGNLPQSIISQIRRAMHKADVK